MGKEKHIEIHKRIFVNYYSCKPNVCYFIKTVDSYICFLQNFCCYIVSFKKTAPINAFVAVTERSTH